MRNLQITMLTILSACIAGCTAAGSPIETVDLAASALSFQPNIVDTDPAPADGMVPVVATYFRGNQFVELATNTSVTCNGVVLPWTGAGYTARVPIVPAGGTLTFVHSRAGVKSQVVVTVPARPVVTAPAAGQVLSRDQSLVIQYIAERSAGVRPSGFDGVVGVSGSEQSDSGIAYLDVRTLHAGAGTIDIERRVLSFPSGTGFDTVLATYTIGSGDIPVTWQ